MGRHDRPGDDSTGPVAAYNSVMEAYMRADPRTRDDQLIGDLRSVLYGEVVAPRCTFVGGYVHEHEGAVTLLDGRALCKAHRVEVLTSRAERVGRASRTA